MPYPGPLVKDRNSGAAQLAELQAAILKQNALAHNLSLLHKFFKLLNQCEWSCCVIKSIVATTINTHHCLFGIKNSGNL